MEIKVCDNEKSVLAMAALAKTIWSTCYQGIITDEQAAYMIDKFQSYEAIKQAIETEHYTYFQAWIEHVMVGYCGVQPQQDRLFLSKLYLLEAYRGKGIGTALIKQAIEFAKRNELKAVYLTVNKQNESGITLYKHLGFQIIDAVQSDIGHGYIMDDYIMELKLS